MQHLVPRMIGTQPGFKYGLHMSRGWRTPIPRFRTPKPKRAFAVQKSRLVWIDLDVVTQLDALVDDRGQTGIQSRSRRRNWSCMHHVVSVIYCSIDRIRQQGSGTCMYWKHHRHGYERSEISHTQKNARGRAALSLRACKIPWHGQMLQYIMFSTRPLRIPSPVYFLAPLMVLPGFQN